MHRAPRALAGARSGSPSPTRPEEWIASQDGAASAATDRRGHGLHPGDARRRRAGFRLPEEAAKPAVVAFTQAKAIIRQPLARPVPRRSRWRTCAGGGGTSRRSRSSARCSRSRRRPKPALSRAGWSRTGPSPRGGSSTAYIVNEEWVHRHPPLSRAILAGHPAAGGADRARAKRHGLADRGAPLHRRGGARARRRPSHRAAQFVMPSWRSTASPSERESRARWPGVCGISILPRRWRRRGSPDPAQSSRMRRATTSLLLRPMSRSRWSSR